MGHKNEIRLAASWGMAVLTLLASTPAFPGPSSGHNVTAQRFEHLDLRPPMNLAAGADKTSNAFPSALHRQTLGQTDKFELPSLGTQAHTPGRIEQMARRFHREGLPVARLWENKSALVSLGLNQRGKPGLWLIQKGH